MLPADIVKAMYNFHQKTTTLEEQRGNTCKGHDSSGMAATAFDSGKPQDQENSLLYSTALWQTLHANSMCTTSNDNTYHMHLPQELPQELPQVHVLQGQCQKRPR